MCEFPLFSAMIDPFYMWRPLFCGPRKQPRTVGLRRLPGIGGKDGAPLLDWFLTINDYDIE